MNCKPGDLAIIVESSAANEGKIVRCIRLFPNRAELQPDGSIEHVPSWEVDRDLVGFNGVTNRLIADRQLRPIRDQDGEDEILRLVGKPETEQA